MGSNREKFNVDIAILENKPLWQYTKLFCIFRARPTFLTKEHQIVLFKSLRNSKIRNKENFSVEI